MHHAHRRRSPAWHPYNLPMPPDHDASYKLLFSSPELVRDLVLGFIPDAWLHSLDYRTLEKMPGSYVTDDLRHRADDVVWRVKVGPEWVYLYIVIEFQSKVDPWMAVRMMSYVGLLYQDLIKAKQVLPQRKLPPVLPIVLYNGDAPWKAATNITDLIPKVPGLVAQFLPSMQKNWGRICFFSDRRPICPSRGLCGTGCVFWAIKLVICPYVASTSSYEF